MISKKFMYLVTGESDLAYWRRKIPLEDAVAGTMDGRTGQGLRRAAGRLSACKETRAEGQILTNFHRLVLACQQLSPAEFHTTTDQELSLLISMMQEENLKWPEVTKFLLVMRKAATYLSELRVGPLMEMLDPWGERCAWDPHNPCLRSLSDQTKCLQTWKKLLFHDLLGELLSKGESGQHQVKSLCDMGVKQLEAIDAVELDHAGATALDEGLTIFRALHALCTPSMELVAEVAGI